MTDTILSVGEPGDINLSVGDEGDINLIITGSGTLGVWGEITGTLSDQTDLQAALDAKEEDLTFSTGLTRSVNTITTNDSQIIHDNLTSGTIASHDTSATGAQLDTLTDNSIADLLHRHSELVASDGSPDPALSVDTTGNIVLVGTSIKRTNTAGNLNISGGNATNNGGNINLLGGSAGDANDIQFRSGATIVGKWDDSLSTWDFQANNITTTGLISGGDLKLTAGNPEINTDDSTTVLSISASTAPLTGGNIVLVPEGHPAANDIIFNSGATNVLRWDDSAGYWDFQANDIVTTGAVGIGTTTIDAGVSLHIKTTDIGTNAEVLIESTGANADAVLAFNYALGRKAAFFFREAGSLKGRIEYDDNTNLLAFNNSNTQDNQLLIDTSGNVGIGTASPSQTLHVMGQTIIDGGVGVSSSGTLHVRQKGDGVNDGLTITSSNGASHRIWKDANGVLGITNSSNVGTYFTTGGNVGVNTNSPDVRLHVVDGDGTVPSLGTGTTFIVQNNDDTTDDSIISILAGATGSSIIDFADATEASAGRIEYDHSTDEMLFNTSATTQMTLDSNGDLIINDSQAQIRTAATTSQLNISGGSSPTNGGNITFFGGSHASQASKISFRTDSNTRMTLEANGNVIINEDLSVDGFMNHGTTTELTIATDTVTATQTRHTIDTEADAASDELRTINGGTDGDILFLSAENSARTIVVRDGAGNMRLAGDFSMDHTQDVIHLLYDGPAGYWIEVSRSNNG